MHVSEVLADLQAEQADLDTIVADLDDAQWELATASPRWTVTDQVAHLTYFDLAAARAITDPDGFRATVDELMGSARRGDDGVDDFTLDAVRGLPVGERLGAWRDGRRALADAAATLADDDRVPWYGPSMGAKSFLTARLMECWAHGQDIVDAVGASRSTTDRLRHIAQLGVITRGWTYANRRREAPEVDIAVELTGPGGDTWRWGAADSTERVQGEAVDFCLVVTQRRHLAQTGLTVDGDAAVEWLTMAQAFAGPPTDGPY
ncbi:MAG: TIGR03084 family metal-binding protein [Acidimicrobiia bacterium]|nr:TIGR03084 family metal-binding protein [Acidimicrobiia bacterium]